LDPIHEGDKMSEKHQFQDPDTNGLMDELFNTQERLQSREYKTMVELDKVERIALGQAHLIMHAFFVDPDATLNDKVKMVAEVLLAGEDLQNEYPEPEILNEKIAEVKQAFDKCTTHEHTLN